MLTTVSVLSTAFMIVDDSVYIIVSLVIILLLMILRIRKLKKELERAMTQSDFLEKTILPTARLGCGPSLVTLCKFPEEYLSEKENFERLSYTFYKRFFDNDDPCTETLPTEHEITKNLTIFLHHLEGMANETVLNESIRYAFLLNKEEKILDLFLSSVKEIEMNKDNSLYLFIKTIFFPRRKSIMNPSPIQARIKVIIKDLILAAEKKLNLLKKKPDAKEQVTFLKTFIFDLKSLTKI